MAKTVIALLGNLHDAEGVVRELVSNGIARDDIGFKACEQHGVPGSAALNESEGGDAASILVTVAAGDAAKAETAVTIMKRHGAVEIDERAAGSRQ